MVKSILRSILFSYLSFYVTQLYVGGFVFGGNYIKTVSTIIIGFALFNILIRPVFKLMSLPSSGIFYLLFNFIMTLITMYVLTIFIREFNFVSAVLPVLRIFGFVLPSARLTIYWTAVVSAFVFSLVFNFLSWLSCGDR